MTTSISPSVITSSPPGSPVTEKRGSFLGSILSPVLTLFSRDRDDDEKSTSSDTSLNNAQLQIRECKGINPKTFQKHDLDLLNSLISYWQARILFWHLIELSL